MPAFEAVVGQERTHQMAMHVPFTSSVELVCSWAARPSLFENQTARLKRDALLGPGTSVFQRAVGGTVGFPLH
jgi:hypothetical protein